MTETPNPYESSALAEVAPASDMQIARGKLIAWLIIGVSLGSTILTTLLTFITLGPDRLPAQVIRFGLTAALCYGFYTGRTWVRYLMVVLGGLTGILSFTMILYKPGMLSIAGVTVLGIIGIIYGGGAIVMVFSRSLLAFLNDQAAQRA